MNKGHKQLLEKEMFWSIWKSTQSHAHYFSVRWGRWKYLLTHCVGDSVRADYAPSQLHIQWFHVDSLQSAMIKLFTSWKLADNTNQVFLSSESWLIIYQLTTRRVWGNRHLILLFWVQSSTISTWHLNI